MPRVGHSTEVSHYLQAKLEDSGTRVSDLARQLVQLQVEELPSDLSYQMTMMMLLELCLCCCL